VSELPSAEQLDNADRLLATDKSARIEILVRQNCAYLVTFDKSNNS